MNVESKRPRRIALLHVGVWVAMLYFGRPILIPVALALLLAFVLEPSVTRLQRLVGSRALAVGCVMAGLLLSIGILGSVVGRQVAGLLSSVPAYQDTIVTKAHAFRERILQVTSGPVRTIDTLSHELAAPSTAPAATQPAETMPSDAEATNQSEAAAVLDDRPHRIADDLPATVSSAATAPSVVHAVETSTRPDPMKTIAAFLFPALSMTASGLMVILIVVMVLLSRDSLRDAVVGLAGDHQISLTTQAMEDAATRVSAYLRAQSIINCVYGAGVGAGAMAMGVPGAVVCGLFAGILRFVPIVGVWIGAIPPILLALASHEGWAPAIGIACVILSLELLNNFALEPWLYGARTGISSLGVVLALLFWTWIWGGIGLVLAMPVTVCLLVFSRLIPQLAALPILFSDQPVLTSFARFYHRLLVNDEDDAAAILAAQTKSADGEPEAILDEVVMEALSALRRELQRGAVTIDAAAQVARSARDVAVDWLWEQEAGSRAPAGADSARVSAFCLPLRDAIDQSAAEVLAACLERAGCAAKALSADSLLSESVAELERQDGSGVVLVVAVHPFSQVHARRLCKAIRRRLPKTRLVFAALGIASASSEELRLAPDIDMSVGSLKDAVHRIPTVRFGQTAPIATET